jgi:hypothetical protein
MKNKILLLASLFLPAISFAQNATASAETATWFSPYYPLINSPYLSASIVLIRDVTIIAVLWLILYKQFGEKEKGK